MLKVKVYDFYSDFYVIYKRFATATAKEKPAEEARMRDVCRKYQKSFSNLPGGENARRVCNIIQDVLNGVYPSESDIRQMMPPGLIRLYTDTYNNDTVKQLLEQEDFRWERLVKLRDKMNSKSHLPGSLAEIMYQLWAMEISITSTLMRAKDTKWWVHIESIRKALLYLIMRTDSELIALCYDTGPDYEFKPTTGTSFNSLCCMVRSQQCFMTLLPKFYELIEGGKISTSRYAALKEFESCKCNDLTKGLDSFNKALNELFEICDTDEQEWEAVVTEILSSIAIETESAKCIRGILLGRPFVPRSTFVVKPSAMPAVNF